ncbi:hypothetical protein ElyMa_001465800 [Elysia marginata]|uniref:Uncharacterized protein n=1 Tax=Elysia marginata TaxID=1093978 RepID=A0AAV4J036_9GAST|nr:hypothetical protein ElyMa_001465800 [Elysia marginata]
MTDALENHFGTISIGGRPTTNLRFADDIDGLAGNETAEKGHAVNVNDDDNDGGGDDEDDDDDNGGWGGCDDDDEDYYIE